MKTGFTLFELMIALLIVAILAVVAVVSYRSYIVVANRADATQTLLSIQLEEEKYRLNNTTYGTLAQVWGGVSTSEGGYYTLSVSNAAAASYTITATAIGTQVGDTECSTITLAYSNGTTTRTPAACWGED